MTINNKELLNEFFKHEKLNVAIVTDIFFPTRGGVSFVVDNLARALISSGKANVAVFTGDVKGYQDNAPYPVIRTKSFPIPKAWGDSLPLPAFDGKLKKLIDEIGFDVVDVHSVFGIATFFIKYAKKRGLPIVYHGHGKFDGEYPTYVKFKPVCNFMVKRGYKIVNKADLVMPVSNNTKENYVRNGVTKPALVLPNATDLTECCDKEEAFSYVKNAHGILENEQNVLLIVTRLEMECKNFAFLLDSLKKVKDKAVPFKLLIVGGGRDKNKIEEKINENGLTSQVIMVGEIKDRKILSYYYRRADLFVFPSVKDNCCLVKLESAGQFTPTVAIENTGSGENIIDGENGYLSAENEDLYADKIIQALSDKERLAIVSNNAKETLAQSWKDRARTLLEEYQKLKKS